MNLCYSICPGQHERDELNKVFTSMNRRAESNENGKGMLSDVYDIVHGLRKHGENIDDKVKASPESLIFKGMDNMSLDVKITENRMMWQMLEDYYSIPNIDEVGINLRADALRKEVLFHDDYEEWVCEHFLPQLKGGRSENNTTRPKKYAKGYRGFIQKQRAIAKSEGRRQMTFPKKSTALEVDVDDMPSGYSPRRCIVSCFFRLWYDVAMEGRLNKESTPQLGHKTVDNKMIGGRNYPIHEPYDQPIMEFPSWSMWKNSSINKFIDIERKKDDDGNPIVTELINSRAWRADESPSSEQQRSVFSAASDKVLSKVTDDDCKFEEGHFVSCVGLRCFANEI